MDKLTLVSEDPGGKLPDGNPGKVTMIIVGPGEDNGLTESRGKAMPRWEGLDRLYLTGEEPRKGGGETTEISSQGEEATEQGDLEPPAPWIGQSDRFLYLFSLVLSGHSEQGSGKVQAR